MSALKKECTAALATHQKNILAKYKEIGEEGIKTLTVEDKWLPAIQSGIDREVNAVAQQLAGRVKELEVRYAQTLPELEQDVEGLNRNVQDHLKQMGLSWT